MAVGAPRSRHGSILSWFSERRADLRWGTIYWFGMWRKYRTYSAQSSGVELIVLGMHLVEPSFATHVISFHDPNWTQNSAITAHNLIPLHHSNLIHLLCTPINYREALSDLLIIVGSPSRNIKCVRSKHTECNLLAPHGPLFYASLVGPTNG